MEENLKDKDRWKVSVPCKSGFQSICPKDFPFSKEWLNWEVKCTSYDGQLYHDDIRFSPGDTMEVRLTGTFHVVSGYNCCYSDYKSQYLKVELNDKTEFHKWRWRPCNK
jgi:hypothetical protein